MFNKESVEYKKIKDIYNYRRGSFPQPYTDNNFYGGEDAKPFVQVADMLDDGFKLNNTTKQTISKIAQSKSVLVKKGTALVSLQGTIGRVAITQYDAYVDRTIAIFTTKKIEDIDTTFFAYVLKQKFDIEKKFARGTTLKTITKEEFSEFEVPIPPLPIQKYIVEILSTFDSLCNDLTSGLPAEIELHKQRYEYYRDKLLTFKEKVA